MPVKQGAFYVPCVQASTCLNSLVKSAKVLLLAQLIWSRFLSWTRSYYARMKTLTTLLIIASLSLLCLAAAEVDTARWTSEPWIRDSPSNQSQSVQNALPLPDLVFSNISGKEPSALVVGGKEIPFEEYASRNRSDELWTQKGGHWSQYASSSAGEPLTMIAYAPEGGTADVYRIDYSHNATYHRQYELMPGYSSGEIALKEPGRVIILMAVNDQPSNGLIIDVTPEEKPSPGPADLKNFYIGDARLTVTSNWLKGYDVYVDGVYRTSDQKDGQQDGNTTLGVSGGRTHTVTISKIGGIAGGPYKSEYVKKFDSKTAYTLKI